MDKFVIEKDIPIPESGREDTTIKFMREMSIGDSFYIEGNSTRANTIRTIGYRLNSKFTIRKYRDGYRCWRIK